MFYKRLLHCIIIVSVVFPGEIRSAKAQRPGKVIKWIVEKASTLYVKGKSNMNRFTCSINEYAKKDTLICYEDVSKPVHFTGEIQMDVLSFNCHSRMITKGLRKTLKADEYPQMSIRFISLQYMPLLQNKTELIKGWVEVELAGVVKRFELSYSFLQSGPASIQLNGGRSFHFSDFKLSPPRKFGGLIRIKDEFDVNFLLVLRTV